MVAFLATVAVAGLHAQKKFVMLDKVVAVVGSSAIMHSEVEDLANQIVEQRRAEGFSMAFQRKASPVDRLENAPDLMR